MVKVQGFCKRRERLWLSMLGGPKKNCFAWAYHPQFDRGSSRYLGREIRSFYKGFVEPQSAAAVLFDDTRLKDGSRCIALEFGRS